ncbi:MAG: pilus assembly protein TadG-related protein, partial [Sphingomicrobium sp.]
MTTQLSWLGRDRRGAVAPTLALSLFALVGAGGIAFDYARLASLDTELQQAADQAALAAATQLDQQ